MTEEPVIVVVANKLDLASPHREVPLEQAREYVTRALGPEAQLYEVSAKEDDGTIEDIFLHLTRVLVDRKQYLPPHRKKQPRITEEQDPPTPSQSCCGLF
ncbi:hypothetical protein DFQ30_005697 [Apophysomyces sp. BC1015]|nr:hypothetical protein DFQ30_005697 [Apophysomyces sp. BC1015]